MLLLQQAFLGGNWSFQNCSNYQVSMRHKLSILEFGDVCWYISSRTTRSGPSQSDSVLKNAAKQLRLLLPALSLRFWSMSGKRFPMLNEESKRDLLSSLGESKQYHVFKNREVILYSRRQTLGSLSYLKRQTFKHRSQKDQCLRTTEILLHYKEYTR